MTGFWNKKSEEVLAELKTSASGLSEQEAKNRLSIYGRNYLPKREKKEFITILISQFKNPLIAILIFAAFIALFTGDRGDAIIILLILLLNSLLGFFQEYKSEKALEELISYVTFTAKVIRNNQIIPIDSTELVLGDIVLLELGDRVPVDLRIIQSEELAINESVITGESYPVHKITSPIDIEKPLPQNMKNIAFMGTIVSDGRGIGVVIATGDDTHLGKTAAFFRADVPESVFQKNIRKFGNFLLKVIIVGIIIIFFINALVGRSIFDSLLFSLALAVGIIPESLPIIITITLSRGALSMSKKGVIVKKLVSIEDLGNIDVICTDKTGTLTESKIELHDYYDLNSKQNEKVLEYATLCSSVFHRKHHILGNPIDLAIVNRAKHINLSDYKKIAYLPFDYERRRMSVVVRSDKILMIIKGSHEAILAKCSSAVVNGNIVDINTIKREVNAKLEEFLNNGYRLVCLAFKEIEQKETYSKEDEKDLILFGFLTFIDPLKKTAPSVVKSLEKLGVSIKILTGDDPILTKKVAEDVGLRSNTILLGLEIDSMTDEQLRLKVDSTTIFARITPSHKFRIISALKDNGHIVGFLGDGVNDAPALRESDVGISVNTGSDVSKDAADIILTRKSLRVLEDGIKHGREIFGNVTKYILNTISANIGNMITLGITSVFLPFFPLLPSQILLANFISDAPLLTISTDKVDVEELKKPKRWNIKYISRFAFVFGGISVIFDFITIMFLIFWLKAGALLFRTGWFLESVFSEILVTFAIRTRRPFYKSRPSNLLLITSIITVIITFLLIYSSKEIADIFSFTSLPYWFLGIIILILILYFLIAETIKYSFNKYFS